MKRATLLSILLILALPLAALGQTDNPRTNELFNFGWKFHLGQIENAAFPSLDDSGWRSLDLPHDFQIEAPWVETEGADRGFKASTDGWYRKTFSARPEWKGKKVLLDFDGIMLWGEVWFNGKKAASIDYGYIGTEVDITDMIDYEGPNVVAVYASTVGNSRWYTGGGLFRDVYFVVKSPVSIAHHGVYITTPDITADNAQVQIQVEMDGITKTDLDIEIEAAIFAPSGEQVASTRTAAPKGNRLQKVEVPLPAADIASPQLWSCETPNLYSAVVSVKQDGKTIDSVTETFGIRTVEFTKEQGFLLNGKKVFLKGAANHHDLGALGAAAFDSGIERLFKQLKSFGFNHIRTSHNPYSESFIKLADKYGILIVDELTDKWSDDAYWPGHKPFTEIWFKMVPEWIKRDRNHPSVIMWSLGNELQMREDLIGFPTGDWGITTYRILDILAKRYDSSRKTTVAMYPSRANAITRRDAIFKSYFCPPELSPITEVTSYNYNYADYQKYLQYEPDLIIYQSEATTSELLPPFFGMDRDKMVGLAYWGAVEYWGESNGWPKKGWNYSFFSHSLEPYPQAYLIKSAYSDEPLVRIGVVDGEDENLVWNDVEVGRLPVSSHWNRIRGSKLNIFTYTNAEEVELLVNGKSLGIQKNDTGNILKRNMIYWKNVPYGNGGNIVAIARTGGKEVARHRLETTGKAVALKLEAESEGWTADGMDLKYVKVYAVDSKGRKVPTAQADVTVKVSGEASLYAFDHGDHFSDALFSNDTQALHNGTALVIMRPTQNAGQVTLEAMGNGLKSAKMTFNTERHTN